MYRSIALCLLLFNLTAVAHEMTPTYPTWDRTAHDGIKKVTMSLWNSRKDVQYYEIGVFTKDFEESVPFVTLYSILKVEYLSHVEFDVYMTEESIKRAVYICSLSKLRSNDDSKPLLATQICSKFKRALEL
jgi:hypothetical protein